MKKYIITLLTSKHTRIYLETDSNYVQFFPADYDAGTPARLELDLTTSFEFEDEVTVRPE